MNLCNYIFIFVCALACAPLSFCATDASDDEFASQITDTLIAAVEAGGSTSHTRKAAELTKDFLEAKIHFLYSAPSPLSILCPDEISDYCKSRIFNKIRELYTEKTARRADFLIKESPQHLGHKGAHAALIGILQSIVRSSQSLVHERDLAAASHDTNSYPIIYLPASLSEQEFLCLLTSPLEGAIMSDGYAAPIISVHPIPSTQENRILCGLQEQADEKSFMSKVVLFIAMMTHGYTIANESGVFASDATTGRPKGPKPARTIINETRSFHYLNEAKTHFLIFKKMNFTSLSPVQINKLNFILNELHRARLKSVNNLENPY